MLLNPLHLTVKRPSTNRRAQILLLLVTLLESKVPAHPQKCFCRNLKTWARVFCLPSWLRATSLWQVWLGAPTLFYSLKMQVVEMNMQWRCFLIMILKLFNVILKSQINIREEGENLHPMLSGQLKLGVLKCHSPNSPNIVILWPGVTAMVLCSTFSWEPTTTMALVSGIS